MCSIAEDQSLPVDLNGTSLQMSSPMDSTVQDATSSLSSEVEPPGTFPNLTSAGRMSPHRIRTMKDQELQLAELRKDNFGLKLRIYHLEEALTKKWGDKSDGWQLNIDLQVQLGHLKTELAEKDALILQAKEALSAMAAQHEQEINELRHSAGLAEEVHALEEKLEGREAELEEAQRQSEDANARANELQALTDQLEGDLREREEEMEEMQRELEGLRGELAEEREAAKAVPVKPRTNNVKVQTSEPVVERAQVEGLQAQLANAQAMLQESEGAKQDLQAEVVARERRVKELEVELLTASQRLASGASDHAQQMREQATQLDQCRANLRDAEAELRQQGAELGESRRVAEEAERRAKEAEERTRDLEPRVRAAEREAQEQKRQLREAQAQAEEEARSRAREIRDLQSRLREAEDQLGRSRPEMSAREREVEELTRNLREREEEVAQLKAQLREKEGDVSRARRATHAANMERQEQAGVLEELRGEVDGLREQLQQQQSTLQQDTDAALAAKDAIIGQLKRELQDLHNKLADAEERLLHLTTSKAAELGVLQGTIEDLSQQLEQLEGQVRALKREVGQLTGEKAALQREVDKLRAENEGLLEQLAAKNKQLQVAQQAIADLQRLVEELQKAQPHSEDLEREAAEKAELKAQVAALSEALRSKEEEAGMLAQTVGQKDGTIRELQQQLRRAMEEAERERERARELQREKSELEGEVAGLQSQGRIAQLSSEDLQGKLTEAYREREEMARRLRQAEEALGEKDSAYDRARRACEALQRQVAQLQEQVMALSQHPETASVGVSTSTPPRRDSSMMAGGVDESVGTSAAGAQAAPAGGSTNTTMIFGSLSEDLLRTILQKLQELYAEILTNRAAGSQASSSLSAKMEYLTELQKHLEASLHDSHSAESKPASGNTSYTAYYFMRGEDGEPLVTEEDGEGVRTPRKSSTPKKASPKTPPKFREHMMGEGNLHEAQAQISSLQSELEEVKRWNDALQTRLKESGGTRDVGVGMEKGAEMAPSQATGFAPEKYLELEAEVDRLLGELEAEKERSQAEREQQESECAALQGELSAAEERVVELERQLKEAMMRDAATSTAESETLAALREEVEGLRQEVAESEAAIAGLRGRLQAERDDNQRLRGELAELRLEKLRKSPAVAGKSASATASMPNLLTPDRTPGKKMADSWTSPGVVSPGQQGEGLDMRELKERHEEVTRLNQELQRKCREQLHKSPPSAGGTGAASSGGGGAQSTSFWQAKLREQEQSLRSEMLERERSLLAQLRQSEARCAEKEAEARGREAGLKRQVNELETRLGQCGRDCESLRAKLTEALAACREKDEERINLTRSLAQSTERVQALEQQLEELLASKNATIRDLEEEKEQVEGELQEARERAEELVQTVEALESVGGGRGRGGGEEEEEGEEVRTLQESVDSLSQQLTSALEELEEARRQNTSLEEQRGLLHSQLSSCQEQVATLQSELQLYQKLLQDSIKQSGGAQAHPSGQPPEVNVTAERVLQLLEEVRHLREQLNRGIRNSDALANQLRSKLGAQESLSSSSGSHTHTDGADHVTVEGTQTTPIHSKPAQTQTSSGHAHLYTWSHTSSGVPSTTEHGTDASLHRHHLHTATRPEAKPLSAIGTLTVTADVQMSDGSTISLPQSTHAARPHGGEASFLPAPQDHSSPLLKGVGSGGHGQHLGPASHSSGRTRGGEVKTKLFGKGAAIHKSTQIAGGGSSEFSRRQQSHEYLSREGIPKLEPALSSHRSSHSHQSSSSSSSSAASLSDSRRHNPSTTPRNKHTAASTASFTAAHPPHPSHPLPPIQPQSAGEFESLESRLKKALDSPTLQGADRSFLEELLMYLRQQRRQLDESWRVLEQMEQQQQQQQQQGGGGSLAQLTVDTAQSGTIPTSAGGGATGVGGARGGVGGARGGGVDLSALYEHLLKTHTSLVEAKGNLYTHPRNT